MNKNQTPTPVSLTRDELVLISNALNEICNGLNWTDEQLQTRVGYTRKQAQELLAKISGQITK